MTRRIIAEFTGADALLVATRAARSADYRLIDAYSPHPIEEVSDAIGRSVTPVRVAMLIGGFAVAASIYALEWWSAVVNYPINSGGRPLHSWPAFMLVPFSLGILSAAVCGLVAFFVLTGLPRLHHPLFGVDGFERVTQDRFALELAPDGEDQRSKMVAAMRALGAIAIHEVPA